ncbi:MAG: hypothetical protein A2084_01640 [Tenericutes bacterium GWC2_39_45]|nr:MAG: hypothetical protein A2Y43_03895 [Tenericutes bacterium GWA2_38_26]OHE31198.1 MAG: hypothetical protein A2084_01640 [Tenericutes bacterium GWC2_39_45]OHE31670.1 MAG: hypothetical protein A2009_01745 [Tenericutes bacterium GWD2_38_27]
MELKEMFQRYYENSLIHKAAGTCDYERSKMNRILKLLNELSLYDSGQIDKNVLNRIISALKLKCSNKTINKLVLILKQSFRFNEIDFEYLQQFSKLREGKRRFNIIEHDELKAIMNHVVKLDSSIGNNLLYQVMVMLMLETGIRANELINIEIKNIDIERHCILLTTTKTKKERFIFFTSLSEYFITLMLNHGPVRKQLLFNSLKCREALACDLKYLIDKLKKELDISMLHAHMFRHTFATLSYNNGMDIFILKELLGHENIATTQIYTHITQNKLQAAYSKTFGSINQGIDTESLGITKQN